MASLSRARNDSTAAEQKDEPHHPDEHPAAAAAAATTSDTRTAVIFDYDWSLINCNSDTYIFEQLFPEKPNVVEDAYREIKQWTKSVDRGLELLHQDKPAVTVEHILQCVAAVPVQDYMLDAVRYAHEQLQANLYIVSDANTAFIEAFLKDQGLWELFQDRVVSNQAILEQGERFVVRPYHDFDNLPPHGCSLCPPNMCKGHIVEKVLGACDKYDRIIYIGDGGGDYCPSTRLRKDTDFVLARTGYSLAKKIAARPIQAAVREWETGADVLQIFRTLDNDEKE